MQQATAPNYVQCEIHSLGSSASNGSGEESVIRDNSSPAQVLDLSALAAGTRPHT
jgi:hypothetical protein